MKTKFFLLTFVLLVSITLSAQQIGNGQATYIENINTNLSSGFYKTDKAQPVYPHEIPVWPWKHLIHLRGDGTCHFQISTPYTHDDNIYFRKVVINDSNPNATNQWYEVATRGKNTFTGEQFHPGNGTKIGIGGTEFYKSFNFSAWGIGSYISYPEHLYFKGHSADKSGYIIFTQNGHVGIGTLDATHRLNVKGTIRAEEIIVETGWADFVFKKDYQLPTLEEVKKHIEENKHLPGIPSEKEIKENGIGLSEITTKMMQKIEELTLYVIQQNKEIEDLKLLLNTKN